MATAKANQPEIVVYRHVSGFYVAAYRQGNRMFSYATLWSGADVREEIAARRVTWLDSYTLPSHLLGKLSRVDGWTVGEENAKPAKREAWEVEWDSYANMGGAVMDCYRGW